MKRYLKAKKELTLLLFFEAVQKDLKKYEATICYDLLLCDTFNM